MEFLPVTSGVEDESHVYEIVGTGYHNSRQPFIRYKTGDFIRFQTEPPNLNAIADGLATFTGISGRYNDVLTGPEGELLVGIDHIPRGLEKFGRFQFVQLAPDFVEILVASPNGGSAERKQAIMDRARIKIPTTVAIEIRFVDELRKTEAGKTPLIFRQKE